MISTQFLVASGQRRANQLTDRLQIAPVGQAAIRKQHGMCNQLKFMPRPPRSCSEHTGIEKFIPDAVGRWRDIHHAAGRSGN
jgi:hypothetical protein